MRALVLDYNGIWSQPELPTRRLRSTTPTDRLKQDPTCPHKRSRDILPNQASLALDSEDLITPTFIEICFLLRFTHCQSSFRTTRCHWSLSSCLTWHKCSRLQHNQHARATSPPRPRQSMSPIQTQSASYGRWASLGEAVSVVVSQHGWRIRRRRVWLQKRILLSAEMRDDCRSWTERRKSRKTSIRSSALSHTVRTTMSSKWTRQILRTLVVCWIPGHRRRFRWRLTISLMDTSYRSQVQRQHQMITFRVSMSGRTLLKLMACPLLRLHRPLPRTVRRKLDRCKDCNGRRPCAFLQRLKHENSISAHLSSHL